MTKYVNIVTASAPADIQRQIDAHLSKFVTFTFCKDRVPEKCDLLVILHRSALSTAFDLDEKHIPILYISLEASEPKKEISSRFLKQFDYIWSSDSTRLYNYTIQPTHTWWLGVDVLFSDGKHIRTIDIRKNYEYYQSQTFALPQEDRVLIISSTKELSSGHVKRTELIKHLLNDSNISSRIDVFGHGYQSFSNKHDLIEKYRYIVVIENECKEDYWTEKLADVILLNRQFIYVGCTNISDYFPNMKSYNYYEKDQIAHDINTDNFCSVLDSLAAKNLILNKYNIVNQIYN